MKRCQIRKRCQVQYPANSPVLSNFLSADNKSDCRLVRLPCVCRSFVVWLLASVLALSLALSTARGQPPQSTSAGAPAARQNKIPDKIEGAYRHGKLVPLRVRDRIAFVVATPRPN